MGEVKTGYYMKYEKHAEPSQRELFVTKMQEMILTGQLQIHERIQPERELAEQMGISRTIVNMGIAVLESQGFLEVIPRQGVFVADYRKTASVETMNAIMRLKGDVLTDSDIRSILQLRWALERLTIKNAMDKLTDGKLESLELLVERIGKAKSDEEAAENAMDFQRELAYLGENQMLALIFTIFRKPCIAMWVRFCKIYGIETLYLHTKKSFELLKAFDYKGMMEWIEQFSMDAIAGDYTLYEADLAKVEGKE